MPGAGAQQVALHSLAATAAAHLPELIFEHTLVSRLQQKVARVGCFKILTRFRARVAGKSSDGTVAT